MLVFYHGTTTSRAEKILKEGLIPQAEKGADALHSVTGAGKGLWEQGKRDPSVFVSTNVALATMFAQLLASELRDPPAVVALTLPPDLLPAITPDEYYQVDVAAQDAGTAWRIPAAIPASHMIGLTDMMAEQVAWIKTIKATLPGAP